MNVTIQNAMSGKIPTAPKSSKSSKSANKGHPPVDPKVQIEGNIYGLTAKYSSIKNYF